MATAGITTAKAKRTATRIPKGFLLIFTSRNPNLD
jgi:hypothetical protein